jgi:hypothetical protein
MTEKYDLMTYNDNFIEVAKYNSDNTVSYQHVFTEYIKDRPVEDFGSTPMRLNSMFMDSIDETTVAFAYHRDGREWIDNHAEWYGDEANPDTFHNPFGLESIDDIKQLISYRKYLNGSIYRSRELWQQIEDRDRLDINYHRFDAEEVLEYETFLDSDKDISHKISIDDYIQILENTMLFNMAVNADYGLKQQFHELLVKMYQRQAEGLAER